MILFENKYIRTPERQIEHYKYMFLRSPLIWLACVIVLIDILQIIIVLYRLYYAFIWDIPYYYILDGFPYVNFILSLVYLALLPLIYFRNIRNIKKVDEELHNNPIEITTCVYDDLLHIKTSSGEDFELKFESIKKAYQTKNYIALRTKAKVVYLLKKDSFTWGTPEMFCEFLRSKGYKIYLK